jgi:FkbM family methyltransferase
MRVGFVFESYHSEVLEFLLDIYHRQYNASLIVYNNTDSYGNIAEYKELYPGSLVVKPLSELVPDIVQNYCEKFVLLTFENLFLPSLLVNYKDKLLFITHNQKQLSMVKSCGFDYFALTPAVCNTNWMLPLTLKTSSTVALPYTPTQKELEALRILKESSPKDLTPVMTIGHFREDNKDLKVIEQLLESKKIMLFVFTKNISKCLQDLAKKHPKHLVCFLNHSTSAVRYFMKEFDIKHVLYAPPQPFPDQVWSGTLAFAFTNNLVLVMPEYFKELYKMHTPNVLGYTPSNIDECLHTIVNKSNGEGDHENVAFLESVVKTNTAIVESWRPLDGIAECHSTEYGRIFCLNNDVIGREIMSNGYHEKGIVETLAKHVTDNTVCIDVGSNIGSTSLGIMNLQPHCQVISFEAQTYLAQLQKKTMLVNHLHDRIRIYNNAVGHTFKENITLSGTFNEIDSLEGKSCKVDYNDGKIRNYGGISLGKGGQSVDMLPLDAIDDGTPVSLIKIDVEGAEQLVVYGARTLIKKYKPVIFYEDNWKKLTQDMKETLNLSQKVCNFNIDAFLREVGYKQKLRIDDNWLWVYDEA